MFFTSQQIAIVALLAFAYIASVLVAARRKGLLYRHSSTFLGCITFSVAAVLAAKNLLFLLTATRPVQVMWGRAAQHEFLLKPSEDPFIYSLSLLFQAGVVCGCFVLAYSVYSNRAGNEA